MPAVATKAKKPALKPKAAPAKKPLIALITIPALAQGEEWSGVMFTNGVPTHSLILLPGEQFDIDFDKSGKWAKNQHKDGRLPTRPEQCLLRANLPHRFKPRAYWSSEQSALNGGWAWYQDFSYGSQDYDVKSSELACRAVRSIPI